MGTWDYLFRKVTEILNHDSFTQTGHSVLYFLLLLYVWIAPGPETTRPLCFWSEHSGVARYEVQD